MTLSPGTTLGLYQVTAKIGEGGMARCIRPAIPRSTAMSRLKVLPPAFVSDPDRLARFQREAKVLASLNHPNIGGIHGLEDAQGVRALVRELIEGPTLADRMADGPLAGDDAISIARQISQALESAHESASFTATSNRPTSR